MRLSKLALIPVIILFLLPAVKSSAQFSYDIIVNNTNGELKLTVKDAATNEPMPWVTVYLTHPGDTVITNFALSDEKGNVKIKDIPAGRYEVNAEFIGYLPYRKEHTLKGWQTDLGIVKLKENPEYIDAATISAVGNPIVVKKDTIEYNASSFKVGENAMLEDLLKRMPGMEVAQDGSVKVNGEAVDKITVGGRTFFFNEPSLAVKNLPAKIVNKIRVIDKDKESASFSGISGKDDKEKVMDVELKEEYKKGWFGNAKAGGGSTLTPKSDDPLIDSRGGLYNATAMVSAYGEKDQVVILANALNAEESGSGQIYIFRNESQMNGLLSNASGLTTSRLFGANYNTDRIRGCETDASVSYKHQGKDGASTRFRTSWQPSGQDLFTQSTNLVEGQEDGLTVNFGIKNIKRKKAYVNFNTSFSYTDGYRANSQTSETDDAIGNQLNSSSSNTFNTLKSFTSLSDISTGIKNLGKKDRSLSFNAGYDIRFDTGNRTENTRAITSNFQEIKNLTYDIDNDYVSCYGRLAYVEPFGNRWKLRLSFIGNYLSRTDSQDAFSPEGVADDYYSSQTDNRYLKGEGQLLMQYKNDTTDVQFGLSCEVFKNETVSKSLGTVSETGKGDWQVDLAPFLNYRYNAGNNNFSLYYSGNGRQVQSSSLKPVLDITNPVIIRTGNIYLKPSFSHFLNLAYSFNNREKFTFFRIYGYANLSSRDEVEASWFDDSGIRYSVPVNAKKPSLSISLNPTFNRIFGKTKHFSITLYGRASYNSTTSYQAASRLPGLDTESFNYYDFIAGFYGNSKGDKFYSGDSGFSQSRSTTLRWSASASLKYSIDKLDLSIGMSAANAVSRYSLNKSSNLSTWDFKPTFNAMYQPGRGWEFKTDLSYNFYRGYSNGFGSPEWNWNIKAAKTIKKFTLSLSVDDVLNQTRNLRRSSNYEYSEDVYSKILGRFFLASVSFNFGKMNSAKNAKVQNAMWNMM